MEQNYNIKDINFIRKGSGKKVLLLHGWGVDLTIYSGIFEHLSKYFDTIALDLPGFGKSPIPSVDWGIYQYADIIYQFIKYHNFYPCSLLGHSFGGRIAIILGSKYSDILDKIILVDSAGIKPKRTIKYYYRVYTYKILKFIVKTYCVLSKNNFEKTLKILKDKLKIKGSSDYENAKNLKNIFVKVVNQDLSCDAKNIKKQTLIIWGEKDDSTPLYMAKKLKNYIKDSGLVIFENAGHYSFLEQFNKFTTTIIYFLNLD